MESVMQYLRNLFYFTCPERIAAPIAAFLLALVFITFWVRNRVWIWSVLTIFSLFFLYKGALISPYAVLIVLLLAILHSLLLLKMKGGMRGSMIALVTLLSWLLCTHFIPGFRFWSPEVSLGHVDLHPPSSLFLHFDTPWIGLFPLALTLSLFRPSWRLFICRIFLPACAAVLILVAAAYYFSLSSFKFGKLDMGIFSIFATLFFRILPEEGFYRTFLQRELNAFCQTKRMKVYPLLAVALIHTVMEATLLSLNPFNQGICFLYLLVSRMIYSTTYACTGSVESTILSRFFLYLTSLFFFAPPIPSI